MPNLSEIDRRDVLKGLGTIVVSFAIPKPATAATGAWPKSIAKDQLDSWLAIAADGKVTCFTGRVDIGGTGVRTAIAQIVADELDVDFARVEMVMGDTASTPDQGITSASATIQKESIPIRHAAAEARRLLVDLASKSLGVPAAKLTCSGGVVTSPATGARVSYGDLIGGKRFDLRITNQARIKKTSEYKIVGKSIPRADIAAKVTATFPFVHDVRRPGMLHGRVIRPPYTGSETAIGANLISVDEFSIRDIPGIVKLVRIGDFLGVVAEREENAIKAAGALKAAWKPWSGMPDFDNFEATLRAHPGERRVIVDDGDAGAALGNATQALSATYIWPYQHHASLGPSCAVAELADGTLTIWSPTRAPHAIRKEAARLLDMSEETVRVIQRQGAGCYGLNCADDVSLDAALLARAVGRPVRVQLMREQEQGWEPKAAAQLMECRGGLDADGNITAYQFSTKYFTGRAETLAHYLTGAKPAKVSALAQGDRNATPPYGGIPNLNIAVLDVVPPVRAAVMRGVASLPNSFAHECFMDELAFAAKVDPLKFRLDRLDDPRARAVLQAAAEKAGWQPRSAALRSPPTGPIAKGRGLSYARYTHGNSPAYAAAYAAWVADVEVDMASGHVRVTHVVVAQDAGLLINPAGVRLQIHGNVIQATSRTLMEQARFDRGGVISLDYMSYPIARFADAPEIDIVLIENPNHPPLGVGESASVPSAGAIGNAIFDAIGVRMRQVPFTPQRIKNAMTEATLGH